MHKFTLSFLTVLLLFGPAGRAATLKEEIGARVAQPLLDRRQAAGLVVGILHDGKREVFGYGEKKKGSGVVPDGKTIFQIGSITKTFTALALAWELESDRGLSLDSALGDLFPPALPLSPFARAISLRQLCTHTSGLPVLAPNFLPRRVRNPYADYTTRQLMAYLAVAQPFNPPGTQFLYSNWNAGIVGNWLAWKNHQSYAQLIQDRITSPLEMKDTLAPPLSAGQRLRLAQGYDTEQKPTADWTMGPAMAGAGALYSTADDLLTYVQAGISPPQGRLGAAIARSQQPLFEAKDALGHPQGGKLAMNWAVVDRRNRRWIYHEGMVGGFNTFAGFSPEGKMGLVVLSNQSPLYQTPRALHNPEAEMVIDRAAAAILDLVLRDRQ